MQIGHIALYANDLEAMKRFYVQYFGVKANEGYHNPKTGFTSYFLYFDEGASLEIMNRPAMADGPKPAARTGYIHIALRAGNAAAVDELTARLKADGHEILSGPRTTGDGYYESVVLDPEGNQVEVTA